MATEESRKRKAKRIAERLCSIHSVLCSLEQEALSEGWEFLANKLVDSHTMLSSAITEAVKKAK